MIGPVTKAPKWREERGSAAVEFALIVPLLMILVSGIIQFSVAFGREQALQSAAHRGARVASFASSTNQDITAAVLGGTDSIPTSGSILINITPPVANPCASADSVVVSVSTTNDLDVAFFAVSSITQSGVAEFTCES